MDTVGKQISNNEMCLSSTVLCDQTFGVYKHDPRPTHTPAELVSESTVYQRQLVPNALGQTSSVRDPLKQSDISGAHERSYS